MTAVGRPRSRALPHPSGVWSSRVDLLRGLLFALIVLNLSRLHVHMGIGRLRPVLVLVALTLAFAVMKPHLLNAGKLFTYWPAKVFVALGVLACFSAAFGISLGGAASFFLQVYLKVLIFGLLLIASIRHTRDLATFVWGYVVSCGIIAYFGIFVFTVEVSSGGVRLDDLYTFDANDIATILMSGLPLALLVLQTSRGARKWIAGLTLLGIGATMARSGSRGGFLAFLAVGMALLFWAPGVSAIKRLLLVATAVGALIVAAPPGYWTQMRTIGSPTEDYNWNAYYGRRQLAERGLGYMMRYPFFGVGVGQFPRADFNMSSRAVGFVDQPGIANRWRAAHNSYVQIGAEMGIPGLVLWLALLFGGIVSMRRLRRRLPQAWSRGDPDQRLIYYMTIYLPVSLIGFAVAAFFVSFAYVEPFYLLLAYVVGVHIALATLPRPEPTRAHGPVGRPRAPARVITSPVFRSMHD